jgi:hypothetical protein
MLFKNRIHYIQKHHCHDFAHSIAVFIKFNVRMLVASQKRVNLAHL